jgi:hypothetical protein
MDRPRRRNQSDFLHFRPYRAILAPDLTGRTRSDHFLAGLRGWISAGLICGIPTLVIVAVVTLFQNEFVSVSASLGSFAGNMILPGVGILLVAMVNAAVSVLRR